MNEQFTELRTLAEGADAEGILRAVYAIVKEEKVLTASSFAAEDQVITDLLSRQIKYPRIFTLDTGRIYQEVYDTMESTMKRYSITYQVTAPDPDDLAALIATEGPNCFYRSIELRKRCCGVRKTAPLEKVLQHADAWICGLRRDQSVTRTAVDPVEWDAAHNIIKVNPLYNWTEAKVWQYIKEHSVPYCILHDRGYRSIGCAPCTRAIDPHDNIRSGRWWWESPEHKECGLHHSKYVRPYLSTNNERT